MSLHLPDSALVNRFIAKTKFYEKAAISSKLKDDFVNKIQKITWQYKLSENTLGINKTAAVTEIQVFEIELKEQLIPKNILALIDKVIPYQILYQFRFNEHIAYAITLKGLSDIEKPMPTDYYFSEWNEPVQFDFTGTDLEQVYQKLIKAFIKNQTTKQKDFKAVIETDHKTKQLEKDIALLTKKISKEKQMNRKVELNKTLLDKQQQLQLIKDVS
ncbi:conserved hypothetical protein [Bathymodiolus platifrons methanotrophic gill symbiont]|uniref:DUF4391 domain-containing protein n=1 Tax=Bathymodiolus platifrons methanotrophic gill symbiont TaxID=113268 RepID=UPI000B418B64|nr:DUF4391 domain-containing protein [Bathymodiolus platifrons methanotrophic gill symbiont]TXK93859.1 DUF4391 domain-containing protein [Methylococcaceae bacterium HT1]TXL13662.1 DUF4391 domain-containing protein [Methylococcaceae bacterium HT3]TXL20997.1 DUF4391 domain-containing protein [Methylococcaceae bacterium HT2]GAW86894.1 conserved hypothetical protein [Bathymodiolus platifrons methanotrophic gill symbiont]GFO76431.1 hypothetical protein BPLS_P4208 [Bathymodiolus platifrons methanotr